MRIMIILAVLSALLVGTPATCHAVSAAVSRTAEQGRATGAFGVDRPVAEALAPARTSGGSGASGGRAGSMSSAGGMGVTTGMSGVSGMSGAAGMSGVSGMSGGAGTASTGGTGGARGPADGTRGGYAVVAAVLLLFTAGPVLVSLLAMPVLRYARRVGRRKR